MAQVAWLACLKPCLPCCAKIDHPAHCTTAKLQPCPLHHGKTGSLVCNLIPLSQLLPDETHPASSWWTQAHLNPCQGCHLLQVGSGLSFYPRLHGRGAGWDVVLPKASCCGQGCCLNKHSGVGPETNNLDHRARVFYLPCSL